MMKFIICILFFFCIGPLSATQVFCDFEEVYSNGDIQNGIILVNEQKIRYEYLDPTLYTIFANKELFFLVENNSTEVFHKIKDKDLGFFQELKKNISTFPNIEKTYENKDYKIKFELNYDRSFFKRVSINSKSLSMSIYFNNCENRIMENIYFRHSPYQELAKFR